jgi:cathepsin F
LAVFKTNLKIVRAMNSKQTQTTYGITKFFDLNQQEFRKQFLSKPMEVPQDAPRMENVQVKDVPLKFDWRNHGAVTYVKDQGQCGSCWAFSTTGNIEGVWFLANNSLVPLSEQQLVDCDHECDPEDPKDCDAGCNGGLMSNAFRWIIKNGFITTEHSYPYYARDGKCKNNTRLDFGAKIANWTMLPANETQIQSWLFENGPVSIAINANPFQYYKNGIISGSCDPKELNHGVLLTGWGCEKDIFSHNYFCWWNVKNSWSSSWGEQGYARLAFGKNQCGLNSFACTALLK